MNTNKIYQVRSVIDGEEYILTDYEGEWRFETLEEAEQLYDYECEEQFDADIRIVRANWDEDKTIDEDEVVEDFDEWIECDRCGDRADRFIEPLTDGVCAFCIHDLQNKK